MSNTLVHWTPAKSPKSCFKKRPRFKGRGMMNGGGVDVALAEQGFDTFKLLESLGYSLRRAPQTQRGMVRSLQTFVGHNGITLKINMEPKHQGFWKMIFPFNWVIFVYFCWLEYVFPFGARPLFRGDLWVSGSVMSPRRLFWLIFWGLEAPTNTDLKRVSSDLKSLIVFRVTSGICQRPVECPKVFLPLGSGWCGTSPKCSGCILASLMQTLRWMPMPSTHKGIWVVNWVGMLDRRGNPAGTVGTEELVQDWGLFGEMSSGAFYLDFFWGSHSTCIEMRCHE